MPAPIFVRGIGGKVTVGAGATATTFTEFAIVDWNLTKTNTLVETTHSGSAGFSEYFPTKTEASGSFNAIWDSINMPDAGYTANAFGANSGDSGADTSGTLEVGKLVTLKLYLGDSGKFYSMPARIESLAITVNATSDVVKFSCNFKSSGVITDPVTA
jgi:hypothetical protein